MDCHPYLAKRAKDGASGPLSFRVPYMPEGFQYAAWFDSFYGDLATVGNWSAAQPLQCGYPATGPSVGDYLTVDDTLPTPASATKLNMHATSLVFLTI